MSTEIPCSYRVSLYLLLWLSYFDSAWMGSLFLSLLLHLPLLNTLSINDSLSLFPLILLRWGILKYIRQQNPPVSQVPWWLTSCCGTVRLVPRSLSKSKWLSKRSWQLASAPRERDNEWLDEASSILVAWRTMLGPVSVRLSPRMLNRRGSREHGRRRLYTCAR